VETIIEKRGSTHHDKRDGIGLQGIGVDSPNRCKAIAFGAVETPRFSMIVSSYVEFGRL
jgi:hypothetical protein